METMDHCPDSSVLIEAEIETLMRRFLEQDIGAMTKIEMVVTRLRKEFVFEIVIH